MSVDRGLGVASLILGLAGTGIALLWPTHRWVGWAFLVGALSVAVLGGVWALARYQTIKEYGSGRPSPAPLHSAYAEAVRGGIHLNVGTISQQATQQPMDAKYPTVE